MLNTNFAGVVGATGPKAVGTALRHQSGWEEVGAAWAVTPNDYLPRELDQRLGPRDRQVVPSPWPPWPS